MQEHTAFGNNVYQGTLNPMWPQCLVAQQLLVQFFPRSLKETYIQPAVLTLLKFTQTAIFFLAVLHAVYQTYKSFSFF